MSQAAQDNSQKVFQCPECGLHYKSEDLAKQCEAWCKKHKSCNFLIERQSIEAQQKAG